MAIPRPPPIPSYFVRLPIELQYELLDKLSYDELLELCNVPGFGRVCYDNTYWARRAGVKELTGGIRGYLPAKYGVQLWQLKALLGIDIPRRSKRAVREHDDFFGYAIGGDNPERLRYFMEALDQTESERYNTFKRNLYEVCLIGAVNILCWLAKQGVWFGKHKDALGCAQVFIATGDLRALECIDKIMNVDWSALVAAGTHLPLASLKYIIENKSVTKAAIKARAKISGVVGQTELEYLERIIE